MTLDQAVGYYLARLTALTDCARSLGEQSRGCFLTYDDLTQRTRTTLDMLASFLGLSSPLSQHYRRFQFTGVRGDPSEVIMSGVVVKEKPPREAVSIPPEIAEQTREAYQGCERALLDHCTACRPD